MSRQPKVITDKQLMSEWHFEKNASLGYYPDKLSLGSGKPVWWICPKGHEYESTINNRHQGRGCRYCSGKAPIKGENDFATIHPDLAKEWHPTKNGDNKPSDFTCGSGFEAWWICNNHHEYKKSVRDRSRGAGCSECSKALKTSFPEQAVYFYIKQCFPDAISRYKDIFDNKMELDVYIPSHRIGIEYDGAAYHTKELIFRDNLKYQICKENNITLIRIMEESDSNAFILYDRKIIVPNSNRKHLNSVISELCCKLGKPINVDIERDKFEILNYLYSRKESLASEFPEVAEEWDYEANKPRKPEDFAPHSNERVGWICRECGYKWVAMINDRTGSDKTGCPKCSPKKMRAKQIASKIEKSGSLYDLYPDLMEEWDYKRNTIDPKTVLPGSKNEAFWKCKKCGYVWSTPILKRTIAGHGCRLCAKQDVVMGINDLATRFPDLAAEWDYENNELPPTEIAAGDNSSFSWICSKCGQRWKATANNRTGKKSGCPYCSGRRATKGVNDFKTLYPEYALDWDYDKNDSLPEDYKPGSDFNAHWKCIKCGHEWQKKVKSRVKYPACPNCRNHYVSKKERDRKNDK